MCTGAGQQAGSLAQTVKAVVPDEVQQAVKRAAGGSKDSGMNEAPGAKKSQYDDSEVTNPMLPCSNPSVTPILSSNPMRACKPCSCKNSSQRMTNEYEACSLQLSVLSVSIVLSVPSVITCSK